MIGRSGKRTNWWASGLVAVVVAVSAAGPVRAGDVNADLNAGERGWMLVSCQAWHERIAHRVDDQERAGTIWEELAQDVRVTLARLADECPQARDRDMLKRMVALFDLLVAIEDEQ